MDEATKALIQERILWIEGEMNSSRYYRALVRDTAERVYSQLYQEEVKFLKRLLEAVDGKEEAGKDNPGK